MWCNHCGPPWASDCGLVLHYNKLIILHMQCNKQNSFKQTKPDNLSTQCMKIHPAIQWKTQMTFSNICRKEVIMVNILFYHLIERNHQRQFKGRWTSANQLWLFHLSSFNTVFRTTRLYTATHANVCKRPAASANWASVRRPHSGNTLQHYTKLKVK